MSMIDKLLAMDAAAVSERPARKVEIPRLSALLGEPFAVTLRAMSAGAMREAAAANTSYAPDGTARVDSYGLALDLARAAIEDPPLSSRALLDKYGCAAPAELMDKLFTAGEVAMLASAAGELAAASPMPSQDEVDRTLGD